MISKFWQYNNVRITSCCFVESFEAARQIGIDIITDKKLNTGRTDS